MNQIADDAEYLAGKILAEVRAHYDAGEGVDRYDLESVCRTARTLLEIAEKAYCVELDRYDPLCQSPASDTLPPPAEFPGHDTLPPSRL